MTRPAVWMLLLGGVVAALGAVPASAADEPRLRIAITPVLVEHYLEVNRQLVTYVGERLGRTPELVQRRSYKEISDLLEKGEVDVASSVAGRTSSITPASASSCSWRPSSTRRPCTTRSIVPRDSPVQRFEDLRGKRYAFSDPLCVWPTSCRPTDSPGSASRPTLLPPHYLHLQPQRQRGSGRRALRRWRERRQLRLRLSGGHEPASHGEDPDHRTVRAAWDYPRGRPGRPYEALKSRLRAVFLEMDQDPKGHEILRQLMITRFVTVSDPSTTASARCSKSWAARCPVPQGRPRPPADEARPPVP